MPNAIVCLLTALRVHDIGTQVPWETWIAIPHGDRAPSMASVNLEVTRFSGTSLQYGVVETEFEGVPARITTRARTVVACFRFRSRMGLDAATRRSTRSCLSERRPRTRSGERRRPAGHATSSNRCCTRGHAEPVSDRPGGRNRKDRGLRETRFG